MSRLASGIACGALVFAIFLKIPLAHAQDMAQQQPGLLGESISEEELKAFAKAYLEIQQIRLDYEPTVQNVQDQIEIQRIRQETNSRIERALDKQGLNARSYAKIFVVVSADEELRHKTIKLIEKEQKRL